MADDEELPVGLLGRSRDFVASKINAICPRRLQMKKGFS